MNRKKILSGIKDIVLASDIIFCVGDCLVSEACFSVEQTVFYHNDDTIDIFSVAIGMSMATEKRVVVIAEDYYFLKHINSIIQAATSKCKNLYFFIVVSNLYNASINQTTLFSSVRNMIGVIFSLGFFSYNYTPYLKIKTDIKKLKDIYKAARGPLVSCIDLDDYKINSNELKINNIKEFYKRVNSAEIINF